MNHIIERFTPKQEIIDVRDKNEKEVILEVSLWDLYRISKSEDAEYALFQKMLEARIPVIYDSDREIKPIRGTLKMWKADFHKTLHIHWQP